MIVVRTVIQATWGKAGAVASEMAKTVKATMDEVGEHRSWRVMTDLSGPFDTAVL